MSKSEFRVWKHPWGVFPEGRLVKEYSKRDLEINLSLFLGKYRFGNDLRPNSVVELARLTEWKHPWGVACQRQ